MGKNTKAAREVLNLYRMLEQQNEYTTPLEWFSLLNHAIEIGMNNPRYQKCLFNLQTLILKAMQESSVTNNSYRVQLKLLQLHVQAVSGSLSEL